MEAFRDAARRLYPSLEQDSKEPPHAWIQWKGTDVCMDVYCSCGEQSHFDGDFAYHVKCGACGQVYECSGFIRLLPLDFEPEGTWLLRDDSDVTVGVGPQSAPQQTPSGIWLP